MTVVQALNSRASRFDFEPQFTAKILKRHYRIYEVPISFNPRDYLQGKKIKLHDAFTGRVDAFENTVSWTD